MHSTIQLVKQNSHGTPTRQ